VTKKQREKLWVDQGLQKYIRGQARRHFPSCADQEIAISKAWEKIENYEGSLLLEHVRHVAYNAIHAYWKQRYRERTRQTVRSVST
jgi:hypothetical protein